MGNEGLQKIITELQAMHPDMQRLANIGDTMAESRMIEFIAGADLQQCKKIVDALAERVASLIGDASSLEDAAYQIEQEIEAQEIEAQEAKENPPLCAYCNGSGEGQYDGTRCMHCKGSGTELMDEN